MSLLPLTIEKPAAGGRMIARHDGQIVLVSGAIPGEQVLARVEYAKGGVVYASVTQVESPSPDRREVAGDPACGGNVYAHIASGRQRVLKGEILADAFRRIGRVTLDEPVQVRPSPEAGYRMRARLHVRGSRIGFFREGTHDLCDAGRTAQLLPETTAFLGELSERLGASGVHAVRELELAENVPATERAVLIELAPGSDAVPHTVLSALDLPAASGLLVVRADSPDRSASRGRPFVTDILKLRSDGTDVRVTIRRHVASFFQGNRYLLGTLVDAVTARVPPGPVVELYAGAGLFGLACAALKRGSVVAVEGDRHSSQDLKDNARPFGKYVRVVGASVEAFLSRERVPPDATLLVDPPRTGMSRDASAALTVAGARRLVYVSCDVATLARDVRRLMDGGYRLEHIEAFDLFPNTAHVESLAVLSRPN